MRRNLVSYHPLLYVVPVGQPQVLFRRHVAQQSGTQTANSRRPDRRRYVIISRSYVSSQRAEGIKGSLVAPV